MRGVYLHVAVAAMTCLWFASLYEPISFLIHFLDSEDDEVHVGHPAVRRVMR